MFTNTVFGFVSGYVLLAVLGERAPSAATTSATRSRSPGSPRAADDRLHLGSGRGRRCASGAATSPPTSSGRWTSRRYWLAQDLGRAAYHAIFRGVPPFLVGAIVFDLRLPDGAVVWLAFAVSVVLAVVASFAFRFLFNLAAFWLLDDRGAGVLALLVATFFSGLLVPLAFFPDWLETLAWALPFAAMVQTPIEVFLGHATGLELAGAARAAGVLGARPARCSAVPCSPPVCAGWWSRVAERWPCWRSTAGWCGARIRGAAQYRPSFALNLAGQRAHHVLDFVAILILFRPGATRSAAGRVAEVARAVRHLDRRVRARRPRRRPPRPAAAS